ncbi:transglycosylase SLT domain-containing protein [Dyella terrae]|uniref:transglycosylase SLT domain-containing protein n=1 Tax=Dyella terrae TaxID=522259 RepID=UPI001EFE26AC|nr:transglycosylase SLT domain-containing protein [Dyella terrae]ULU23586.1 Transglycosylase SLT domain protein [Dyella terrae]
MSTAKKTPLKKHSAKTTPKSDKQRVAVSVDLSARLKQIRALVVANNKSLQGADVIICQIYMESRFDPKASSDKSSAKGLMQLLKAPIRELYRLRELEKPAAQRRTETKVYQEADAYHDGTALLDEATNIQAGTEYLQRLIDHRTRQKKDDPVAEGFKDYRGVPNGIYYKKIKAAADKLRNDPDNVKILQDMVQ